MASRLSLKTFMAKARSALTAPASHRQAPLTFVVGNESADLDSLCSAVVLAYIRSASQPNLLHIPLSNLPRADLALRTEMLAVLRHAGLGAADLLTLTELPDLKPEDTRWFLVDHNALTGNLKKFQPQVVGCIDHHVDERVTSQAVVPRVVEPCGSCMSLIVDESRAAWDALAGLPLEEGFDAATEDDKLARLCLAPILIDTINLTAKDKIREKDPRSVAYLQGKTIETTFDSTKLFEEISAVKEDITDLSFYDIFRKDYKEWEEAGLKLGISCVVQNFDYLVEKADGAEAFLEKFEAWATERKLDIASIMTTSQPDGDFQRHLLVWATTEKGGSALDRFPGIAERLKLEQWRDGLLDDGTKRMAWTQGDLTGSRKQVAPLLREALKQA